MEMKAPGPEKNREIAELRYGVCRVINEPEYHGRCINKGGVSHDCVKPRCIYRRTGIKPYSTSIVYAMELAREMHSSGDKTADQLLHDAWNWWMAGDDSSLQELADAISGAWLKWRNEG